MSAGREFHVCGAGTENTRRASAVRTRGTVVVGRLMTAEVEPEQLAGSGRRIERVFKSFGVKYYARDNEES